MDRLFLLHNGLNEVSSLRFYYLLADLLIDLHDSDDGGSAVAILPTPGHLSRFPLPGDLGEAALDTYLADPGDLFRQFLRYMFETQWFLTAVLEKARDALTGLTPYADEGGELHPVGRPWMLRSRRTGPHGREVENRARSIFRDFRILQELSARRQPEASTISAVPEEADLSLDDIRVSVAALRRVLFPDRSGMRSTRKRRSSPGIHSVGYSLGGFFGQSIFFSWPSLVGSCASICSGGPLSAIRLERFAQPEEWDAVMHGLKYEVDNSFLSHPEPSQEPIQVEFDDKEPPSSYAVDSVLGLPRSRFRYFLRIFYDVFLQELRSEYAARSGEFSDRMLFVVGGNDAIIRPETVLASGPSGGHNLVQVANLSHFVHSKDPDFEQFWLPSIALLIDGFAERGEGHLSHPDHALELIKRRGSRRELLDTALDTDGLLNALETLAGQLDLEASHSIRDSASEPSHGTHVWITRSRVPTIFSGDLGIHYEAARLYRNDVLANTYARRATDIGDMLRKHSQAITLVVSEKGVRWMSSPPAALPRFPAMARGRSIDHDIASQIVGDFEQRWNHTQRAWPGIRVFSLEDSRDPDAPNLPRHDDANTLRAVESLVFTIRDGLHGTKFGAADLSAEASRRYPVTNAIPEAWMVASSDVIRRGIDAARALGASLSEPDAWFVTWARILFEECWDAQAMRWNATAALRSRTSASSKTQRWFEDGQLSLIRLSRARSDSRMRGLLVRSPTSIPAVWAQMALSYAYSSAATDPRYQTHRLVSLQT
ncbi:MAG: hypothetical protein ACQGVC_04195 [Myxococcota bacterium]